MHRSVSRLILLSSLLVALVAGRLVAVKGYRMWLLSRDYPPAPKGMILIPPGEFLMGSDRPEASPDERPLRRRFLPAYYIDRHEVTHREYAAFRRDHRFAEEVAHRPVTGLLKADAEAYARFVGKRLPTGAEWEKAARGTDGRRFPWGNTFEPGRANVRPRNVTWVDGVLCAETVEAGVGTNRVLLTIQPVGSFPEGASPYGVEDMCGNVWEWVADEWQDRNALGFRSGYARGVLRGGAYAYPPHLSHASYQAFESLETTCNDVGFRCVQDVAGK